MKIPREAQQTARKLYQVCLGADGSIVPEKLQAVVQYILKTRPRFTANILQRLYELCRLNISQNTAKVTSAHPLGQMQNVLTSKIKNAFPTVKDFEFIVDPSLIGGLRLQLGSNVWDGSIKEKLKLIQEQLSS